jgi:putative transposase
VLIQGKLRNGSWHFAIQNEQIARLANAEDHCTGRFWEGRFKSQALLDARAVLACMAYVDLNPIRAAIARTPEQSDYTSIQERILRPDDCRLRPFAEHEDDGIPFGLKDYLDMVDWAGREIKHNKRGYIPAHTPPILTRLRMDASPVLDYLGKADQPTFSALGPVSRLRAFAQSLGQCFVKGQALGKQLWSEKV